jgi:hypothetical protein
VLRCGDIQPLVSQIAGGAAATQSRPILRRYCGELGQALADPKFAEARIANAGPFGWQFPGTGGLDLSLGLRSSQASAGLAVTSQLSGPVQFAHQALRLEAGRYAITVIAHDQQGRSSERVEPRLACAAGTDGIAPDAPGESPSRIVLDVSPGCPAQRIELWLAPGNGPVTVEKVALYRM